MRVLVGHNYYRTCSPSGENSVVDNEIALLERGGVDVHLFGRFNDSIEDYSLQEKIRVAFSTAWSKAAYKDILKVLGELRPDVAHFHNTFPLISPSVFAACHEMNVPVVQTIHNFRNLCPAGLLFRDGEICEKCSGRMPFPALRHRCYRDSFVMTAPVAWMVARNRLFKVYERMVDRIIAPTRFVAKKLVEGGFQDKMITVKPHFLPDPVKVGNGRGGYVLFAGRISEEKGVCTLIEAWKHVDPTIKLYVAGDGVLKSKMESYARDARLNVKFIGMKSREELLGLMQDAIYLVVPSECYETFGMSVIESYACGTPVIVSDLGGLSENVVVGKTGWVIRPGDCRGLAKIINESAASSSEMMALRHNSKNLFDERFSASRNFSMLMKLYNKAILERRSR